MTPYKPISFYQDVLVRKDMSFQTNRLSFSIPMTTSTQKYKFLKPYQAEYVKRWVNSTLQNLQTIYFTFNFHWFRKEKSGVLFCSAPFLAGYNRHVPTMKS